MNFISTSHKGLVHKHNQDYLGDQKLENGHLFVVCDGLSGLPKANLASRVAVESVLSFFLNNKNEPQNRLQESIIYANKNVKNASTHLIGTTITAAYLENKTAYVAWCGDSRIYQFNQLGIKWFSKDHNVLHDILNKGLSNGNLFQNPKAITRFIGQNNKLDLDFHQLNLRTNDILLLCSDGLHEFIFEPDIETIILKNSIKNADILFKENLLSKKIGAPDNFSWYLIKI